MVSAFLKKTAEGMKELPPAEREESLTELRARMQRELKSLGSGAHEDEVVARALLRSRREHLERKTSGRKTSERKTSERKPSERGAKAKEPDTADPFADDKGPESFVGPIEPRAVDAPPAAGTIRRRKRARRNEIAESRWLGVCAVLAAETGVAVGAVRGLFFVLGLVTWPIALWIYIGVYFAQVLAGRDAGDEGPNGSRVVVAVLGALAWIAILFAIGWGVQWIGALMFERFLDKQLLADAWVWLPRYQIVMLLGATTLAIPLTILGALPLTNGWDLTLKKYGQVVIAIYGAALMIGVICMAVGATMQVVSEFTVV